MVTAEASGGRGGGEVDGSPIRRVLLLLVLLGMVGLILELALLEHIESVAQWIPFAVLGLGLVAWALVAWRPAFATLRFFQATMVLFIATGLLGLFLHFRGNTQFELEEDPSLHGVLLVWRALRGATPALAPGALIQLGLLGLVFAYGHPALRRGAES